MNFASRRPLGELSVLVLLHGGPRLTYETQQIESD